MAESSREEALQAVVKDLEHAAEKSLGVAVLAIAEVRRRLRLLASQELTVENAKKWMAIVSDLRRIDPQFEELVGRIAGVITAEMNFRFWKNGEKRPEDIYLEELHRLANEHHELVIALAVLRNEEIGEAPDREPPAERFDPSIGDRFNDKRTVEQMALDLKVDALNILEIYLLIRRRGNQEVVSLVEKISSDASEPLEVRETANDILYLYQHGCAQELHEMRGTNNWQGILEMAVGSEDIRVRELAIDFCEHYLDNNSVSFTVFLTEECRRLLQILRQSEDPSILAKVNRLGFLLLDKLAEST